jgi:hypothetical protein
LQDTRNKVDDEFIKKNYVFFIVDVSLYFCGPKCFGDELCMNKYESNYHIHMDLNMLVSYYNYLVLDLCHYLILVCTCEYVHGYALNIVKIHSFCV